MPIPSQLWATSASVCVVVLFTKLISWHHKVKKLPPGPLKLPFIDNLLNMPSGLDWLRFSELSKEYDTDIVHVSAFGNSIVVLDSYEAARELLDKRSAIYSSRPSSVMFELSGLSPLIVFLPYGNRWREGRRIIMRHLGSGDTKIDHSREAFYARRCLQQLLDDPKDFRLHIQRLVGSVAISMAYGLQAEPVNDANLDLAEKLMEMLGEITAGGYMVNSIHFLRYIPSWVPGASFQTLARKCTEISHLVRHLLFNRAVEAMESPDCFPNLISEQLQELGDQPALTDIDLLKDAASTLYLGAADTTWSTLMTFVLAMVCHPNVQQKAQKELDTVLNGQLPEYTDIAQLPYLTAIFMEVSRWKPVTPVGEHFYSPGETKDVYIHQHDGESGFPHVLMEDDTFDRYFIPKGSIVVANQWAMLNDPTIYPEPHEFKPDRFIKDGKIDESIRNPLDVVFGFGRRICPGRHPAQSTFMITAASILSTFDLLMEIDEKGEPIWPNQEYRLSLLCHPKPFPCRIIPRSTKARDLVEAWAANEAGGAD